jgi:type VI secretion system protein ImpH
VSERAIERAGRGDGALADFLDIFNHRLLSLLYRAQKKYRPALDSRPPDRGRVANVLYSLIGLGTPHLRRALGVSERALLPFAGILTAQPRSMIGLEMLVAGYFDVAARVVPFRGRWNAIDESDVTRIGARGMNQVLGESAVLGTRVWDVEASFELQLGPLTLKQFLDFLPKHVCHRALVSLVRFYAGEDLGFTYRPMIQAAEVPELRLGRRTGAMLGWTSWLKTKPFERDDAQVSLMGRA